VIGVFAACEALDVPRATVYRHRAAARLPAKVVTPRASPRALAVDERNHVLAVLAQPEHADRAVAQVYASLLDRSIYLCSIRTMYRILNANGAVRERRDQLRHPNYKTPELLAEQPNQVWSWDITKLLGPAKWHRARLRNLPGRSSPKRASARASRKASSRSTRIVAAR
jgi:putative transposase